MPVLLFTAALAGGQPTTETARWADPAARVSVVQDLGAVVSGTAPSPASASAGRSGGNPGEAAATLHLTGTSIVATSLETGVNSPAQSATALSFRIALPSISGIALP